MQSHLSGTSLWTSAYEAFQTIRDAIPSNFDTQAAPSSCVPVMTSSFVLTAADPLLSCVPSLALSLTEDHPHGCIVAKSPTKRIFSTLSHRYRISSENWTGWNSSREPVLSDAKSASDCSRVVGKKRVRMVLYILASEIDEVESGMTRLKNRYKVVMNRCTMVARGSDTSQDTLAQCLVRSCS
jgi:hypothetical protein